MGSKLNMNNLTLTRLGDERPAGLWITSLPWPRAQARACTLNGAPTYCRPLGQWPGEPEGRPRRLLMVADGANQAPETLRLTDTPAVPDTEPPTAECECFERSTEPYAVWERHRLRISYQGRSLTLAMGLRTGETWHWWEACRMVTREETPSCRVVEMGGAIPLVHSQRSVSAAEGFSNPWLHKHHWLYGQITVRMHANGVCEVYARHVNSKYVDEGDDLAPAVPVVGIGSDAVAQASDFPHCGLWDGSREAFTFGDATFDVADVARLATPEHPGRMDGVGDTLIWQPYRGCALYGGQPSAQRVGDEGHVLRPEAEKILRGMARTLRFSFSLSDRSPRIARYLAPDWWYGLCEEFVPAPLLPVYSDPESHMQQARDWLREGSHPHGFEDGGMARGGQRREGRERLEPGWEGEIPYGQFLAAWRYTDAEDYDLAMRSAYHFCDIAVDHAGNVVRMHGYPPIAFSLPMCRIQGAIAAYLETGDRFLFDTAEKVIDAAYRLHHNAWPRMEVGRDACFLRGALLLYRYFNDRHYLRIAREGVATVAESQRPNGSFGDQGGGSGIHQYSGYVTKPWMGLLAINSVLDMLEMFPEESGLAACARRFADWLMAERTARDGVMSWGYQHDFNGGRTYQRRTDEPVIALPSELPWHQETMARLLGYCALRFNRRDYLDAWAESHVNRVRVSGDHTVSAALQFLPWIQAQLWQTTLGLDRELCLRAVHFGARTFERARIHTPDGPIEVSWTGQGTVTASAPLKIKVRCLA